MGELNQEQLTENQALQPQTERMNAGTDGAGTMAQQPGELSVQSPQQPQTAAGGKAEDTEQTKRMKEQFGFFGPATLLYAVFYAFCMYQNPSGITFPFFVAASLFYLHCCLTRLGGISRKESVFYAVSMMLLAISTVCTDDANIIFFNRIGVFLLTVSLLLDRFFDTTRWGLGKYLGSILKTVTLAIGVIDRPITDAVGYFKSRTGKVGKKTAGAVVGVLIGLPVCIVVMLLLSSADVLFREYTKGLFRFFETGDVVLVGLRVALMFFAAYSILAWLCQRQLKEEVADKRTGEPVIAITATSMLTALYVVFSGVQIMGLFLRKLKLPAGYTYAAYAREGFFQLLAVGFLNLVIVLFCIHRVQKNTVLNIIVTIMSLCTFVMNLSSAMRMLIYIRFYHLTFLRILVLWGLALLTLLFVGVIVTIYKEDFRLFRYSVTVVSVMYLLLSFSHPDYLIAKYNVAKADDAVVFTAEGDTIRPYSDFQYLCSLSADAAPVLVPFLESRGVDSTIPEFETDRGSLERYRGKWIRRMEDKAVGVKLRTFNVSRYYMMRLIK